MRPVLFSVFGIHLMAYGVSKGLAAYVGAMILGRHFDRLGWGRDRAYSLVIWTTVLGFGGAKVYYLLEHAGRLTVSDFGGSGFTWYGGVITGAVTVLVMVRRWRLPWATVAGAMSVPLSVAYGIGRIGCFLAGDGTYGRPTPVRWLGMAFPNGEVPTTVPVYPTPLYESLTAFLTAGILWSLGRRAAGVVVFSWYLILSGAARFLVEILRINHRVLLGLSQPQLWAIVEVCAGGLLLLREVRGHTPPLDAGAAELLA